MRTERNVMIAASKSRPECNASERTPKLPVRTTKNVLRETNSRAEPTLRSAARFFSRPSSAWLIASMVRLDYLNSLHSPERAALAPPAMAASSLEFHRAVLASEAYRRYFLAGTGRPPYDPPSFPLDRSSIPFCDLRICAGSRFLACGQGMECPVHSSDGSRKVRPYRERRDRPGSPAHHATRRHDSICPAGERRDFRSRISWERESPGRAAEPHRGAATEAVREARQAGHVVHRCHFQFYG